MCVGILLVPSCCFLRARVNIRKALVPPSIIRSPWGEGYSEAGATYGGACFSVFSCFLKLGEWQLNLQGINESTIPKVLQYYSAATEHDRSWYKVSQRTAAGVPSCAFSMWHTWHLAAAWLCAPVRSCLTAMNLLL